jgi:REP element-mobilizing transposase RayT
LQHVFARGIERRDIFMDENDRQSFLDRLATILEETQTQCYAWTLIPDHFHLLLQIGPTPLSKVMSRLMTGYAVSFNKRHSRSGHLFQNRYKSVVCEENPYLLELIRYIHLNPLREGLVKDLKELDRYRWCGHSAILGKRKNPLISNQNKERSTPSAMPHVQPACRSTAKIPYAGPHEIDISHDNPVNPARPVGAKHRTGVKDSSSLAEKTIQDILLYFGNKPKDARRKYRQFIKKGIDHGSRPDLQGGGLVRSAGGDTTGLLGRKKGERENGDERILGSGEFVNDALKKAGELL